MAVVESLEDQLSTLIAEIRHDVPTIDSWPDLDVSMALCKALSDPDNSVARFQARLFEDPIFGNLRNGWIEGQSSGYAFQDHMLPLALIRAALKEGNSNDIIAEHRAFAARRKSPLLNYFVIGGCSVDHSVEITRHLRLIIWSDVPNSSTKNKFSSAKPNTLLSEADTIVPMQASAGCAIEFDPEENMNLFSVGEPQRNLSPEEYQREAANHEGRYESVRDVVRCIFLLTVVPVDIIGSWHEATDAAARRLFGGGFSYGKALFDHSLLWASDAQIDGSMVKDQYIKISQFEVGMREVLRHAIDRLNLAKRRDNLVDRAIDLGISLEMLLLHGKNEKTELSFRIAMHGATFVGGSSSEQQTNFAIIKRAYQLRSDGVHSGRLKSRDVEKAQTDINAAINLATVVALKVLDLGRFPNWESECLFSNSPLG